MTLRKGMRPLKQGAVFFNKKERSTKRSKLLYNFKFKIHYAHIVKWTAAIDAKWVRPYFFK